MYALPPERQAEKQPVLEEQPERKRLVRKERPKTTLAAAQDVLAAPQEIVVPAPEEWQARHFGVAHRQQVPVAVVVVERQRQVVAAVVAAHQQQALAVVVVVRRSLISWRRRRVLIFLRCRRRICLIRWQRSRIDDRNSSKELIKSARLFLLDEITKAVKLVVG